MVCGGKRQQRGLISDYVTNYILNHSSGNPDRVKPAATFIISCSTKLRSNIGTIFYLRSTAVKAFRNISFIGALALLSFSVPEKGIQGVWKGGFGTQQVITETVVELKGDYEAVIYEGGVSGGVKHTGIYEVKGDTALILTYYKPDACSKVVLQGNLNKSRTFVDGIWQKGEIVEGNFYLEKQ